jgi:hypothetical protein
MKASEHSFHAPNRRLPWLADVRWLGGEKSEIRNPIHPLTLAALAAPDCDRLTLAVSDFDFRISDFIRTSDFGLRISFPLPS